MELTPLISCLRTQIQVSGGRGNFFFADVSHTPTVSIFRGDIFNTVLELERKFLGKIKEEE